ncbi:hypothetical protein U2P60_21445 [Brucella sp. H1_1004]|uniref:hypothetical protein n=1 Tax=Brucella sp. H1_1004 TaxID=3110109 RepID=UPI0039B5F792
MKFFSDRLSSRVALRTLFWRDMIAVGTTLSLACLAVSLLLAASEVPIWLVVVVFLLPLPYNAFMWHCVWQAADRHAAFDKLVIRTAASAWLLIVVFV